MSERKYTVQDLDDLRRTCEERYLFGSCAPTNSGRSSISYRESDLTVGVEEAVRTHMMAGHTAQDLIDEDIAKEERRRRMLNSSHAPTLQTPPPTRS